MKEELDAVMQRKHAAEIQLAEERADRAEKRRDILQKFAISTTETANIKKRIMDLKESMEDLMRDLKIEIATELLASLGYEQQATCADGDTQVIKRQLNEEDKYGLEATR